MQPQLRQAKVHDAARPGDRLAAILGKQRQPSPLPFVLIENLDGLAPGRRLRGVDLAQIQDVPLHHPAILETLVLDDVPVTVLPFFFRSVRRRNMVAPSLCSPTLGRESARSSLQPLSTKTNDRFPYKSNA
jgi:hypothetical protein